MTAGDVDVLVAGGGPTGLAVAINARLAGMTVLVLEPRRGVIDKACGEGLMPGSLRELGRLGVDPPGRTFVGVRYLGAGASAEHHFAGDAGRGVRRTALHASLAARARELGVGWGRSRADRISQDGDGVEVGPHRARWLVAADGLHSSVRRSLGLDQPVRAPRRYGQRRHYHVPAWTDLVEVYWTPHAEVYVTPVADDLVGVAVLAQRGVRHATVVAGVPQLAGRLHDARPVAAVMGAGPLWQRARSVRQGRVLLAGDAAGYVDAITGEGVRVGLASARLVVQALAGDQPETYPRLWSRETRELRWLTAGLVQGTRVPPVRRFIVPAARRVPSVFGAAVERLAV